MEVALRHSHTTQNLGPAQTNPRVRLPQGERVGYSLEALIEHLGLITGWDHEEDLRTVARGVFSGLFDGITLLEMDELCLQHTATLVSQDPKFSKLAARILLHLIDEEVEGQGIHRFSEGALQCHNVGHFSDDVLAFVMKYKQELDHTIRPSANDAFEYFGLKTVYDRYLLKHPTTRKVMETPQTFFMRVACGLAHTHGALEDAREIYSLMSSLDYLPSSPTLFNAGTRHSQLSSCYLLESPEDNLDSIYDRYKDVAKLSKFAGGIGMAFHRVRSRGSHIKGTNGLSNGIVPFLKTLDSSVAAVNQGGRRKGACCVYLETWHADIESFLELRDNTGDEASRTHNLNLANWVPDLFMERLEADGSWSLFDPKDVPELPDLYGDRFREAYEVAEAKGLAKKTMKARDLYGRMMKTLAQTGNGWMTFKDRANERCNQTLRPENVVHLSNLCTEILEITTQGQTAVCNLGSINLAQHVGHSGFDFSKLRHTVRTAVKYLDRVIDMNFYPIPEAQRSNMRWRPVGLGVMGLQDVFFRMGVAFDSKEARALSKDIAEEIYYEALSTSSDLAAEHGAHPAFGDTRAARGELQFDYSPGLRPRKSWEELRHRIKQTGLRNSLLVAIAPTATIASIAGVNEGIEPQVSNLFKRETLSGEFLMVNRHLVSELKRRGLWDQALRDELKRSEGSIQNIARIPEDLKRVYRTAWELPMKGLIEMAAERGAFIDQSQSLNLFMESPSIGKLSSMYFYAWKQGLKTTYYLRSRPATRIQKATVVSDAEAVTCSLENPESCEACQ